MASIHQSNVSAYHRAVATSGHHGGHNMHLFHRDWHQTNRDPMPPMDRPDPEWGANLVFGTNFLQMHHEMVKAASSDPHYHMMHASIVQWYSDSAIAPPTEWDPTSPIPANLGYEPDVNEFPEEIKNALMNSAASQGVPVETLLQRRSDHPSFSLPLWFTREGVPDGANGEPITGARKLADFKNTNQLGCCIVFPHNSWHGAIGGAMRSTWTAIADPIFYFGVHWTIDRVFDEYKIIEAERRITPLDVVRLRNRQAIPSTTAERKLPAEFTKELREEFHKWRLLSEELHAPPTAWQNESRTIRSSSHRPSRSIIWKTPPALSAARGTVRDVGHPQQAAIRKALNVSGIPRSASASTPKEDAINLLKLAAEVEHSLMVQYLYASVSLKAPHARMIAGVAVEEMGHLITVQNLLLALGGLNSEGLPAEHHFGRDSLRTLSDKNPLRLIFERVSHESLAKYVVVERPAVIEDAELLARVELLTQEAINADPGFSPHPVSALYAAIRWIMQPSDEPFGAISLSTDMGFVSGWHVSKADFIDPVLNDRFATTNGEWGGYPDLIVMATRNAEEACAAIDEITAQGEGLPGSADSHFHTFLRLLNDFEQGQVTSLALPRTPYVVGQSATEDPHPTLITNSYSALWARVFNLRYQMLLLDIGWSVAQPTDSESRTELINLALSSMTQVVKGVSRYMAKNPLLEGGDNEIAGPTYGIGDESLPSSVESWRQRYSLLTADQLPLIDALRNHSSLDEDGKILLSNIEDLDLQRQPHLPALIIPKFIQASSNSYAIHHLSSHRHC